MAALVQWFDADHCPEGREAKRQEPDRVDWMRCLPFVVLHLGCLGVWWVGWSWTAVGVAVGLHFIRMFTVTAFSSAYPAGERQRRAS